MGTKELRNTASFHDWLTLLVSTEEPCDEEAKAKQSVLHFCRHNLAPTNGNCFPITTLTASWSSGFRSVSCKGGACQCLRDYGCNCFLQQLLSL